MIRRQARRTLLATTPPAPPAGTMRYAMVTATSPTTLVDFGDGVDVNAIPTSGTAPTVGDKAACWCAPGARPLIVAIVGNRRIGGSWRRVANQSAGGSGTTTTISWDTEDYDSNDFLAHHATTGTTFTVPTGLGGIYAITAKLNPASPPADTGGDFIAITLSGPVIYRFPAQAAQGSAATASMTLPLAAGTAVQVAIRQTTASAINVTGELHLYRVGD